MRPIGFSTGALAYADFLEGLSIVAANNLQCVELSALREEELEPLIGKLEDLELGGFRYISFHVPSKLRNLSEAKTVRLLKKVAERNWPLIVHPDIIQNFEEWTVFGALLCIENMDKRKPVGRTARELRIFFEKLPDACLCLDLGHARQVDPTMSVGLEILEYFGQRLRQVHVSEVNTNSQHDPITFETSLAFQKISSLIPEQIPVILESRVTPDRVAEEVSICREALPALVMQA
jgi:hypothetical protein